MKIYTKVVLDWEGKTLDEESYEYDGPLALAGGGGGGDTQTQTIQKADPWEAQQPYLKDIFSQAKNLYNTAQPQYYPGQTQSNFMPLEEIGQQKALGAATGSVQQLADTSANANNFLLGDVLRADSNPYMQDYVKAAQFPVYQELYRNTLPAVQSGAVASGQMGGSRQGIVQSNAINDANINAGNIAARMYGDMYGQGLDAMQKGLALAPGTMQGQLMPSGILSGVGEQQRGMEQGFMGEARKEYDFNQNVPWESLAAYQGLIQGTYGGQGNSTATGSAGSPSTAQSLMGAAGAGLSTYTGLNALAGGLGGAAGAGLTAAAPWVAGGMALLSLF